MKLEQQGNLIQARVIHHYRYLIFSNANHDLTSKLYDLSIKQLLQLDTRLS